MVDYLHAICTTQTDVPSPPSLPRPLMRSVRSGDIGRVGMSLYDRLLMQANHSQMHIYNQHAGISRILKFDNRFPEKFDINISRTVIAKTR